MSRQVVRNTIRTELDNWALAQVPPVVFYDTINWGNRPTDARWITVEFFSDFNTRNCLEGGKMTENGTIDVSCFSRAGIGDVEASQIADAVEDHLMTLDLSGSSISINNSVSASEVAGGDAQGRYYGLVVSFEYQHFFTR